jgi:hypothetical protein
MTLNIKTFLHCKARQTSWLVGFSKHTGQQVVFSTLIIKTMDASGGTTVYISGGGLIPLEEVFVICLQESTNIHMSFLKIMLHYYYLMNF